MKILPFTPNLAPRALEKTGNKAGKTSQTTEFAAVLRETRSAGVGDTVSLENHRALKLPPPGDLGRAGQLLRGLATDIRSASPETLRKVHNLEGLIYIYNRSEEI
ncbi:MAG: hypothetical protein LBP55_02425 [Candidatus Adiutrix sp.]|jgi:hypothetical protein|nr:hypothetical protein [Candidatus Adiutrix sp.]